MGRKYRTFELGTFLGLSCGPGQLSTLRCSSYAGSMVDENIFGSTRIVSVAALAAAVGSRAHQAASSTTIPHTTTQAASQLVNVLRNVCGKHTKASWLVAAGVNVAVLAYVSYKLYRNAVVQAEKHAQLKRSAHRLWRLATQGADAAGVVADDLGQPDAAGVYTLQTATGTLYFKQTQPHPFAAPHWEWSTDRLLWIPTSFADSLWYSTESSPSTADQVLIRRLEVEGQLLSRLQGSGSSAAAAGALLPALDVSQSSRDLSILSEVPSAFLCPISMRLMTQPVVTPSGATFDRPALLVWIRQTHTDPVSGQPLSSDQLVPNLVLRDMIHAWLHEGHTSASSSSSTSDVQHSSELPIGPAGCESPRAAVAGCGCLPEASCSSSATESGGSCLEMLVTPSTPIASPRQP